MPTMSASGDGHQRNKIRKNLYYNTATGSARNGCFEFKDAVQQDNEYAYDANGNLTKDLNKGIAGISYNCLNLPGAVTFIDGNRITYTYAADGTKLRTVHGIGGAGTTTDYCTNVIYENGTAKFLLTEEGYLIYKVEDGGKVKYSYTPAVVLGFHGGKMLNSSDKKNVATIHSHGEYTGNITDTKGNKFIVKDNEFSNTDKRTNEKTGLVGYLATPNGSLLEYNFAKKRVETISNDLPSDPKDPERLNNVAPVDNTRSLFAKFMDRIINLFK